MNSTASPTSPGSRALLGAAMGGLAAGAVDILYAFGMAAIAGRAPLRVLQSVASGVLGQAAFEGGVPAALLGLLCHFAITLGAAFVYLLAYTRLPLLRRYFIPGVVAFGAAVYAVMHVIVLPLSAIPFKMSYPPATLAQQLAVHVFLVALPIALCVRRYSATPPVRSPSA